MNLVKEVNITRVMNAVAAGTTDQNSSVIDMQGYEGVLFLALFGALTATQVTSMKVQQGAASNLSDAADLAGTSTGPLADTDGNKMIAIDVHRPQERYVRAVIDRGTANAVIDGVIAIQYSGRIRPVVQGSTVAFTDVFASPAEGTA